MTKILDRLVERITIDWRDFAVTRGGFNDLYWPVPIEVWPDGRPPKSEPEPSITVTGGWCAPWQPPRWDPWMHWYPSHPTSILDFVPTIKATRGGIRFITPPVDTDTDL